MKKRNLFTLLLASILLVGCQGNSVPSTPASDSTGGSDTPSSETSDSTSEEPGSDSTSEEPGSDSTSEPEPPAPTTYSLSYTASDADPADLTVDIWYEEEGPLDIATEPVDIAPGTLVDIDPWTESTELAIAAIKVNGTIVDQDPSTGLYPFTMPSQDSEVTIEWTSLYALSATYSVEGAVEVYFYEQDTFDPSAVTATDSAAEGASIWAYASFNDGYSAHTHSISAAIGETALDPDATQLANGQYVYHFTMPANAVTVDITITTKTSWTEKFRELSRSFDTFDGAFNLAMHGAEIDAAVPYFVDEYSKFGYVDYLDGTAGDAITAGQSAWFISYWTDAASVESDLAEIDAIVAKHLTPEKGWTAGSIEIGYNGGTTVNGYSKPGDNKTIWVYTLNYVDAFDDVYAALVFDADIATSWTEKMAELSSSFNTFDGAFDFSMHGSEIDEEVPYFVDEYAFDYVDYLVGSDNQGVGGNRSAWMIMKSSTADTVASDIADIDALLAEHLTADKGWTDGTAGIGYNGGTIVNGYHKRGQFKTIWVYTLNYVDAFDDVYAALVFDAEFDNTWVEEMLILYPSFFTFDEGFNFSIHGQEIDNAVPHFADEYGQFDAVDYLDGTANDGIEAGQSAWMIMKSSTADTVDSDIAGIEAMLTKYLTEENGWTAGSIQIGYNGGTTVTGYSKPGEYKTIWVYTLNYVDAFDDVYAALVFDAVLDTTWTEAIKAVYPSFDTFANALNFTLTGDEIDNNVPNFAESYPAFDQGNYYASAWETGYYAWAIEQICTTSTEADTAVAAIDALLAEHLTSARGWNVGTLTYGGAEISGYYKTISGKVVWVYTSVSQDDFFEEYYATLHFDAEIF